MKENIIPIKKISEMKFTISGIFVRNYLKLSYCFLFFNVFYF